MGKNYTKKQLRLVRCMLELWNEVEFRVCEENTSDLWQDRDAKLRDLLICWQKEILEDLESDEQNASRIHGA